MGFLEIVDREFGVVPQCIQVLVSQQLLDMVHVRPAAQEFGRATSSERVRRDVNVQSGTLGVVADGFTESHVMHGFSLLCQKNGQIGGIFGEIGPDGNQVGLQTPQRGSSNRNDALLAALAHDDSRGVFQIHVRDLKRQKLRHTDTRRVEHFKHGAVAVADGVVGSDAGNELLDLGVRQYACRQ